MKKEIELLKSDALLYLEEALKKDPEHAKQLNTTIMKLNSILDRINKNNTPSDIEEFETVLIFCKKDIEYIAEQLRIFSYKEKLH